MNHSPVHAAPKRSYVLLFLPLLLLTFHSSAMGQDLRGRFIWSVANSKVDIKPGIVYFRKTFEVQEAKSALLELTCDDGFRVFLNGNSKPEIDVTLDKPADSEIATYFIGGRSDNQANFEGRIDEVAFFRGSPAKLIPTSTTTVEE